jgi:hypothetical protein
MRVKLHPAERFRNFMVHHTSLYARRKKGKEPTGSELFHQLAPFFEQLMADEREATDRYTVEQMNRAIIWAVKQEREGCAQFAESRGDAFLAEAIRKRFDPPFVLTA